MRSVCLWLIGRILTLFFFFKQKTAYEMRISDWSSDVCSSDLAGETVEVAAAIRQGGGEMDAAREGAGELGKAGGDGVDLVLGRHRHEDLAVAMRQHVVDGQAALPLRSPPVAARQQPGQPGVGGAVAGQAPGLEAVLQHRSEEHTSELQS